MAFPFRVARFADFRALDVIYEDTTIEDLIEFCTATEVPRKDQLPLFLPAQLGSMCSAKGSFRHDANVQYRTGWAVDIDHSKTSFADANARLDAANIIAGGYTSPSHTAAAPRYRLFGPYSKPQTPAEHDRNIKG